MSWIERLFHVKQETVGKIDDPLPTFSLPGYLDVNSPTWHYVQGWALERINKARERNDNINRDLVQTAALRGEIKALKELINLSKPAKGLLEEDE